MLRYVWMHHPKSLRVKEMFETLETFLLIERQVCIIRARARKHGCPEDDIECILDLACGHGLLGILLGMRFSDVHVMCVDLEKRVAFDHYQAGKNAVMGKASPRDVEFIEARLESVEVPPRSF